MADSGWAERAIARRVRATHDLEKICAAASLDIPASDGPLRVQLLQVQWIYSGKVIPEPPISVGISFIFWLAIVNPQRSLLVIHMHARLERQPRNHRCVYVHQTHGRMFREQMSAALLAPVAASPIGTRASPAKNSRPVERVLVSARFRI
jgi:hypothetical protein